MIILRAIGFGVLSVGVAYVFNLLGASHYGAEEFTLIGIASASGYWSGSREGRA